MLDLREDITRLIEAGAQPLDLAQVIRRARRRRIRRITGTTVTVAVLVVGAVVITTVRSGPASRLRVTDRTATTIATSPPTAAPLVYRDRSKPPPLRVEADGHLLDITTALGCWFSVDAAGLGHGLCADGVVDPARFVMTDTGATRLVVSSPIPGQITARIATAPPPHGPHELAHYDPATTRELSVRSIDATHWLLDLPVHPGPTAIYMNLAVRHGAHSVGGDAYYGFELRAG